MTRLLVVCSLLSAALSCIAVRADESDKIAADLDAAKSAYQQDLETLRMKYLDGLAKREDAARKNGNKKQVDQIKAEREAFEGSTELPQNATGDSYRGGIRSAVAKMRNAYSNAIQEYVKTEQDEKAKAVEEELVQFEDETRLTQEKLGIKDEVTEAVVVARWAHEVRKDGKVIKRHLFRIYSNGRINDPEGGATWEAKGRLVTLTFPSREAPGGQWQDILTLSPDGKSYKGKNQSGFTLVGVKLDDEETDDKKAKAK